jgi:hypothetical protein
VRVPFVIINDNSFYSANKDNYFKKIAAENLLVAEKRAENGKNAKPRGRIQRKKPCK